MARRARQKQNRKMKLHSSGLWASLTSEIRTKILNTVVDQKNLGWSAFASVSKEWQSIIGARNMAKLKIGQSCVEEFGRVVVRQRHLVKHIYLRVESDSCAYILYRALKKVFAIPSTWESTGPLTLEINAVAVRDAEGWFKNFRWNDDYDTYGRKKTRNSHNKALGANKCAVCI
ncbi:hypothetical protein FLAG1_10270 [Fusarium langsethiae]|uniref:Uncharacterized protein n=1 Tax=Fusarium langsethiae TaxID=179993 RepID=A0A0N0V589_FUSLA|nr:hypothetical protein FLAG1_10270 [Fusarium langsethiae]GKU07355.1 unnamed protein product [Fusarium langsethiae]GKU22159.1 unnamed protein product [Fusarium langsethiae]